MDKLTSQGYYCLAPNQRGYARSSKPENIKDYDLDILVSDIVSFLEQKIGSEKGNELKTY
jgi:pimeloyl-ACP methyl ester carboxylesterase